MLILISNDDGYSAPGIEVLAAHLAQIAEVVVVAPESDRSGASNSLTLDRPLSLKQSANVGNSGKGFGGFYFVNGTPTDCVHLAVTGMLEQKPDMVVSGINLGANMGDDTLYSGTVAAATEGYLLGVPSIAISLCSKTGEYFETAARVAVQLVERFVQNPVDGPVLLNVNVPDIPFAELDGVEVTRLGRRHKAEPVIKSTNPRGETVYWVGPAGSAQDAGQGTDFHAVSQHRVSVTPLQIDLTHRDQMAFVNSWLAT